MGRTKRLSSWVGNNRAGQLGRRQSQEGNELGSWVGLGWGGTGGTWATQ